MADEPKPTEILNLGYYVSDRRRGEDSYDCVAVYRTVALNPHAELAQRIIERWANPEWTPTDLAAAACDIADAAMKEFKKRGWLLDLPAPQLLAKKEAAEPPTEKVTT